MNIDENLLKIYSKTKGILLIFLVTSLPFAFIISNVLFITLGLMTLVFLIYKRKKLDKVSTLSLLVIIYFGIECLGLTYTSKPNLPIGFFVLDKHILFLLVPFIFIDFFVSKDYQIRFFDFLIGSCAIASMICIIGNMSISMAEHDTLFYDWRFSHDRFTEPIGIQAIYFALFITLALMILFERLLDDSSLHKLLLNLVVFIFFLGVLLSLGARTSTFVFFLLIGLRTLMAIFLKRSLKAIILLTGVLAAFFIFIAIHPIVRMRFMDFRYANYDSSNYGSFMARTKIWEPGLEAIFENIWFGVGTGDDQMMLEEKYIKHNFQEGYSSHFNFHNQYFQTALAFGILGLASLLAILFYQVMLAVKKRDFIYFSFLTIFALTSITESVLNRNKGVVFLLLFSFIFSKTDKKSDIL